MAKNILSFQLNKKIIILVFLSIFSIVLLRPDIAKAAYVENQIIDNGVFLSSNRMDQAAIQNFLSGKNSYLASYSTFSGRDNATVPASRIIAEAAQDYGINPQVIMATIQKEQSLITDQQPISSQINYAMGYACPDGGTCGYTGFYNQVANGTWQLRLNFERANGNNSWWNPNISYACRNSSRYYSPGLFPGNNVSFIDDGGRVYKNFLIVNAATASLYCYTPHAYNTNTSYNYYSGSYNFAKSFDNWNWSLRDNPYAAQYYSQSNNSPLVAPSQSSAVYFMYQNTGGASWYDDESIGSAPNGSYPIHLATSHELNRSSEFYDSSWNSTSRPSVKFASVYKSDGSTLADNQHVALPGQIVKFVFTLTPKTSVAPGSHTEFFMPVAEGSPNQMNDPWTNMQPVVTPKPSVNLKLKSGDLTALPSSTQSISISLTNDGNTPLYDDSSIGSAPNGTNPTHLATSCPMNYSSTMVDPTWASESRPAVNFSSVYNIDGTTLADNQHIAQPGQVIKFAFNLKIPDGYAAGTYRQCFQPILEGTMYGYFSDLGIGLNVSVPAAMVLRYSQNTSDISLISGSPSNLGLVYKNVGNQTIPGTSTINANPSFRDPLWSGGNTIGTTVSDLPPLASATLSAPILAPEASANTPPLELKILSGGQTISGSDKYNERVIISPAIYKATYAKQSIYPSMTYGQTRIAYIRYKNDGNVPWFDDSSISTSTLRTPLPVHLATSRSINRNSGFNYLWASPNRPKVVFSSVYMSDNASLATNQHVVEPGQIAEYSFTVSPQAWTNPGIYREFFQPILEGATSTQFNDPWTFLDMNLLAPNYGATFHSLSGYPSIARGSSTTTYISYTNTGNTSWYDDVSFSSAPSKGKVYPIHLATSSPVNRKSTFGSAWSSSNRPSLNFEAVYEPDGTTPTTNQHVVEPGQVARFGFTVTASAEATPGEYREYFQPIPEGATSWNMGGNAWIYVTVK